MTAEKWTCRLCERPNLDETCGYCGYPLSEQWRLPPLPPLPSPAYSPPGTRRTSDVRGYVLASTTVQELE
ncbi:hypothetical protein [Streptomonospora litoralis]|uniref:Uncharacterized protein n=1 Tax=Streptomonospora litoralis TaxID=2498135 RepID=A0A4P6Q065_9ACTN|nr:hypothetical protein [Streptomonospora litoralis]QBI52064.1 hypothetical protein EKD16_01235 [Streptomonospora litoralis]